MIKIPLNTKCNKAPAAIIDHTVKIKVSTYEVQHLYSSEIENLLPHNAPQTNEFEPIIHFDRLSRTVHMLNLLPSTHLHDLLFFDEDVAINFHQETTPNAVVTVIATLPLTGNDQWPKMEAGQ